MPIQYPQGWLDALNRSGKVSTPADAYRQVPMLYRAVNLRAEALSSVPTVLTRNGEEIAWPWSSQLARLIADTERSLLVFGAAYWLKVVKGRTMTGFVCLNPAGVSWQYLPEESAITDPYSGLRFTATIGGKLYGPWTTEQIVYFREPSFLDDYGPGTAPAAVALQHAQLSHYATSFASAFFQGGAQPVTVMNLPEYTDVAEVERFSADVNSKAGGGIMNAFKFLFLRSPDLKVTQLTPPIDSLQMPELTERTTTAVAATLGVPRTMLEASAANYATADSDRQSFWRETIVPRIALYDSVINAQLLGPINYRIEWKPETMDVFQVDEAARASSFLAYTQGGIPPRAAAQILGIDNLDEFWPDPAASATPEPEPQPVGTSTETQTEITAQPAEVVLPDAKTAEWGLLAKKIERRIKSGRDPRCTFDSALLTVHDVDAVMDRCYKGMKVADIPAIIEAVKAPVDDMTPDELRIYNRIIKEMRKRGERWARDIMNGDVPETELKDVIAPVLQSELGTTMGKRLDALGNEFAIPMTTDDSSRYIQNWLGTHVPMTTKGIDQTTADRIGSIIETFRTTPGMTIQDVTAAITPLADPNRAKAIAITETTRAAAQSVSSYKDYLGQRGITMTRVWNTDADELVCPICVPLNGKTEDEWAGEFPDGPPGHVNCRCDTSLRLVR